MEGGHHRCFLQIVLSILRASQLDYRRPRHTASTSGNAKNKLNELRTVPTGLQFPPSASVLHQGAC